MDDSSSWVDTTVEAIASGERNALVGGPFGSNLVSKDYRESGIPVIRGQNMGNGRWVSGDFAFVSDEKSKQLSPNTARPNDIVFTQRGTLGQVAIVPIEPYDSYIVSQSQMKLTVDHNKADPKFIYYLFSSSTMQVYITANAIQTGVPHTNLGILRNMPLHIPARMEEQRAIAHILGTLDDKIELNRQMNATLDEIARTLFTSWFVNFDPVRAKAEGRRPEGMDAETAALFPDRLFDSELGPIPEGWRRIRFGDIASNARDGVSAAEIHAELNYIGLEHMPKRSIALNEWESARKVTSNKSRFKQDDVLFGKLRPYFHKVGPAPVDGICSTDILVVRPKSSEHVAWVLAVAASDEMVRQATMRSSGTRMPRASWKDLADFAMADPGCNVATVFEDRIRPMLELVKHNVHESRTLAELRDTLLPELLSGRVRVGEAESVVGEVV